MPLASMRKTILESLRSMAANLPAIAVTSFCLLVVMTLPAFADPVDSGSTVGSLGEMICKIKGNLGAYPAIVNAAAYVIGSFFAVKSILLYKKHGENPSQPQVVPATAYFFVAAFLLAFPSFLSALQTSIFGDVTGAAGSYGCVVNRSPSSASGLDQMMKNFVSNIYQPMFALLSVISVAVGLTFIMSGLLRGAKTGSNPQAADPKAIISSLIFGAILISIGTVLPDTMQSIFGSSDISKMSSASLISWSKVLGSGTSTAEMDNTIRAVLAFIQIVGTISFVRGWLILKKAVEGGQATIPQGFTHIIGGAMAINIDVMLKILNDTFGLSIIG